ncbi:MAG: class I SAM-dependent methyltransferase [Deltaproteobacteria bacterium]|nr:class I SAM-dependent methyltransferase [Deltaproteobacteria bacterium]
MPLWDPKAYDAWYETPLGKTSDRLERELIFSMADVRGGETALDVGCGTGIYSIELARKGALVTAIDASLEMLDWARGKAGQAGLEIDFIKANALKIPFPDGHFDIVLSVCMICFVKERAAALVEMKRVLRPGGRVVIALLNSRSPWAFIRRIKGLVKETVYNRAEFISPRGIESSLERAGFKDIKVGTCLFFLPINSAPYLASAEAHERIGRKIFPEAGAFLVAVATKGSVRTN